RRTSGRCVRYRSERSALSGADPTEDVARADRRRSAARARGRAPLGRREACSADPPDRTLAQRTGSEGDAAARAVRTAERGSDRTHPRRDPGALRRPSDSTRRPNAGEGDAEPALEARRVNRTGIDQYLDRTSNET